LSCNNKPTLFYGIGNSGVTNTKNQDLKINKLIAERFDLKLNTMDWTVDEKFGENWKELAKKIGFLSTVYSGIESVHDEFSSLDGCDFIDFGYFGEPFRNVEVLAESTKLHFTAAEFVDELYINKDLIKHLEPNQYSDYRMSLIFKIKNICEFKSIDETKIKRDDFCNIHNEYRKSADTTLINLANYYCYSINLLSLFQVETAVKVYPEHVKTNSKLLLSIIKKLQPSILELPVFSHCKHFILDIDNLKLKPTDRDSFKHVLKNVLRKFKIDHFLRDLLRKLKVNESKNIDVDMRLESQLLSTLESYEINKIPQDIFKSGDIRRLSAYVQLMSLIRTLERDK